MSVLLWPFWLLWFFVKFLIWLAGALLFTLWWAQTHLLYLPVLPEQPKRGLKHNEPGYRSPEDFGLEFEDVFLTTRDGVRIHGWLVKQTPATLFSSAPPGALESCPPSWPSTRRCPTVLFFHGNAGNIGYRLPNVCSLVKSAGCNVLIIDYRGYGNSEGKPTESGLILDAVAALDFVQQHPELDREKVFLFGRSLGGAVAIGLADHLRRTGKRRVRGVLVENTFTGIPDMALVLLKQLRPSIKFSPLLQQIVRTILWLATVDSWDNASRISKLRLPLLLLSGRQDEIVPAEQMDSLFQTARKSRTAPSAGERELEGVSMYRVELGQHNDTHTMGGSDYYRRVRDFLWKM